MKKRTNEIYRTLLFRSVVVVITSMFFLILGISCGAFTETLLSDEQKVTLTEYLSKYLSVKDLQSTQYQDILINSMKTNIFLLVLIGLCGFTIIGFPASFMILAYKGITLGFSSALLIENMSYKGTLLAFVTMIPQNVFILPGIFVGCVISANYALLQLSSGSAGIKKSLPTTAGPYISLHGILMVIIIFGSMVEAFLCPILTGLFV